MKRLLKQNQTTYQMSSNKKMIGCPAKGKRYPPKLRAEILQYAEINSVRAASEKYQVSQGTIHVWRHKHIIDSKAPEEQRMNEKTVVSPEERDNQVLGVWHDNPGFGPSQIKNMLSRIGLKMSVATVRNIMEANGYVPPKMKPRERIDRYEASRPRELYHLDFCHFYIHKQKQALLFIQDDFSRYIAGWALVQHETADAVIDGFETSVSRYGKPERVMSDRGSAFHSWKGLSRFQKMLEDYEINFHLAKEPRVNGKVEALNGAFQKECLRVQEFMDLTDAARGIGSWVERYNHSRTHHGLGGILVPADRFYGLAERTLKLIELGHGGHALDILSPEGRGLEIFKVVSHAGNPQVYLMGKKIMG